MAHALHEKPKIGHKTQKIVIVGINKHQESIQRHQKPLFRHLTCHNLPMLFFFLFQRGAYDQKNGRGQKGAWSLGTKLVPGLEMLIMI